MRLFRSFWLAAAAFMLPALVPSAHAGEDWAQDWALTTFFDDINAVTVKIAAVTNDDAFGLKLYAPDNDTRVWATFLLPADVDLGSSRGLSWQVDDAQRFELDVVTQDIAQRCDDKPADLHHGGPHYVSLVIHDARVPLGPASPLVALMSGNRLSVRYPVTQGGMEATTFTLRGAGPALQQVIANLE